MDETLVKLIAVIKLMTPEIWDIFKKQVYILAYRDITIGVIITILGTIGIITLLKMGYKAGDYKYIVISVLSLILLSSGIFITIIAITQLLNVEYSATILLLNVVR